MGKKGYRVRYEENSGSGPGGCTSHRMVCTALD